jgi:hypothetical protein
VRHQGRSVVAIGVSTSSPWARPCRPQSPSSRPTCRWA